MRHGETRDDVGGGTLLDQPPCIECSNEAVPRFGQAVQLQCRNGLQIHAPGPHEVASLARTEILDLPAQPAHGSRICRQCVRERFSREQAREELRFGRIGGK